MSAPGPLSSEPGAVAFCTSCGKPIPENARFCRSCGASQEGITVPAPVSSAAPAPQARTRPWGVTSVALLLILFGVGAFFSIAIDLYRAFQYGWTPWLYYNLALAIFFMPVDFVMAIGLWKGRLWGWKLTVASLSALAFISLFLGGFGLLSQVVPRSGIAGNLFQGVVALAISSYLARSKNVRAYFGAEGVWRRFYGYKQSGAEGR